MDHASASTGSHAGIEPLSTGKSIRVENVTTYDGPGVWIARPSPLGNPWSHKKSTIDGAIWVPTRAQAIANYIPWLDEQLKNPHSLAYKQFHSILERLKEDGEVVLLCFCKPKSCHGYIIRDKLIEALQAEEKIVQCA